MMATATGIAQIDALLNGNGPSLTEQNSTPDAVGFVQDLLIGHGFTRLPGPLGTSRGKFGPMTKAAVTEFQQKQGLAATGAVDRATLRALVETACPRPSACCGYLTLVLDVAFVGMARLMSVTSQFEGAGLFAAMNLNTDKAGLSFGLIQWAQKPKRLHELLQAFHAAQPQTFVQIFGAGNSVVAKGLLTHTAKTRGGTDDTGATTDPAFNLIATPWKERFLEAGRNHDLQRVQVDLAVADFTKSLGRLKLFAPEIVTERGIAFMLDVANQHGDGGAEAIYKKVRQPGLSEAQLLTAVEEESVARVRNQFGAGSNEETSTRNRRQAFRTTTLLNDQPFVV